MKFILAILLCCMMNVSQAFIKSIPPHLMGNCTSDQNFCVYFTPQDLPLETVAHYLYSAKKSIKIYSYNFSAPQYTAVLNNIVKKNENIRIEFLLDFKHSVKNRVWDKLHHPRINKIRIPVMRGENPQMHNKVILIDDKIAIYGSANYTYYGLVGNYENVVTTRKLNVVRKFLEEFNELKAFSLRACKYFSDGKCGFGQETWDPDFLNYFTTGVFSKTMIEEVRQCSFLHKTGNLLNSTNNEKLKDSARCFKNKEQSQAVSLFIKSIQGLERYANLRQTTKHPNLYKELDPQLKLPHRVYFGPEDNIEWKILTELRRAYQNPKESFVYVDSNFINRKNIAVELAKLEKAGVRVRVMFDQVKFLGDSFSHQHRILNQLGFYGEPKSTLDHLSKLRITPRDHPSSYKNKISLFHNKLTTKYGSNHNKFAIVGVSGKLTLINGSVNWSRMGLTMNDENLTISHDKELASIFLKEMISHMFVYRYGQNIKSPEFWDEVNFLKGYDDCLLTQLGFNKSCKGNGRIWHPRQAAPVIFSVFGSPYSPAEYQMFVYVSVNKSKGVSYPIHSYARFGGKWVGSIPAHPAYKKLSVKLYVRNKETGEVIWEKKDARFGRLFKLPTITLKNGDELGIGLQTLHHLLWGRY